MFRGNIVGLLSYSVDKGPSQELLVGSFFVVLAFGCILGILSYRIWFSRNGKAHDKASKSIGGENAAPPLMNAGGNFPGALIQLEKQGAEWAFTLISKGTDMTGPGWDALGNVAMPALLKDVLEESEVGLFANTLDTSALLGLPVNHECRLKTGISENHWVGLMLSSDTEGPVPGFRGIMISIMERRLLEQEIFEEKQFADQIMEYSGVLFSVRNRDKKLIRTNRMFLDTGGYTPEELYFSDGDQKLIGPSYDSVLKKFNRVLEGEYPLVSENPWYCKDGSVRTLRWTNTGLVNSDNEVNYIISVGVDITDLLLLEARLKDRIGTFEALFDNTLVGIALVKDSRIVQANQICAETLGYSTADINGLSLERLFAGPEAFNSFMADMIPRIDWGLRHFDQSFKRKDGTYGDFRLSVSPLTAGCLEDGVVVVFDDISEIKIVERALQRSESRFRTIFDRMASGLALINEEGYFDEVNDSWCRITGYSREEARKLRFLDITEDEDIELSRGIMKRLLSNALEIERDEKRYIRKDGSVLWVDLTASILDAQAESGEVTFISIINDITDRKAIEEKLKEMNRRLELEKDRVQVLADHRMAVIGLFDTFRNSKSIEDIQGILKNVLPQFVKCRDIILALRISRNNPGYVVKDLLGESPEGEILELIKGGRGVIGSVIKNRQIYISGDVRTDPVFIRRSLDVRSCLALPIIYKDFLWGVIGLDHFEVDHFTEQDTELMTMVGTLIAMQMEEMTAKRALHQESDRLRMLHDLVQEMAQARNNQDIHRLICSSGLFSAVHIYTVSSSEQLEPCICPQCLAAGESIPEEFHMLSSLSYHLWETAGGHNLAVQIRYNMEVMGVLRVCSELPFSDQEIELASILSEQTGVFWELNNLIAQREKEAMIDPLTGVWNRRYMIDRLEQEDQRISRYGGKACVAILDMGDFKLINDQYGHVKGDEVLAKAAREISCKIRKTDFVGRYGGDEFILFLPNTDIREAEHLLEKIREGIASLVIDEISLKVEIDGGAAVVPGDDSSLIDAVRTADERMYFKKRERKRSTLLVL